MANEIGEKRSILSQWRARRWKKAQRKREMLERRTEFESANGTRARAEAEGTGVDRLGNLGGGGHP